MSGIFGIWNLNGEPVNPSLLERLGSSLAHRGPDAEGQFIQGPLGMGCRLLRVTPEFLREKQPTVHRSGSMVVFDGRLDNRQELLDRLTPYHELSSTCSDSDLVLAAYDKWPDGLPEQLVGDFAFGLYDAQRRRLMLVRDAIGIKPLYYWHTRNVFIFASEIKALLAHPAVSPRPNDDSLAERLFGRPQDYRGFTCFEGILSLPPSHMAVLSEEKFVTRRYWDFDLSAQTRLGSFQEYAQAFRTELLRAVRRRIRSTSPVAVSLSGGLDSSSIFCLAETLRRDDPANNPPIVGISYIWPDGVPSDEKAFLVEIERDYGVKVHRVPIGRGGFVDGATQTVWHVEVPMLDEQWNTTHQLLETTHRLGARVILTGHWADQVLFDQAYLVDLFRRLAFSEILRHLKEYSRWLIDVDAEYFRRQFLTDLIKHHVPDAIVPYLRLLRPDDRSAPWYTNTLRRRARRLTLRRPPRIPASATVHARALYAQARSSHHVGCMEWDNKVAAMHGLDMAFPFLDRDLLSFLMSIPGEVQTCNGRPKALLREGMRGVLPDAIASRSWKADFTYAVNEAVEQEYPSIVEAIGSSRRSVGRGYVKGNVVTEQLGRLKQQLHGPTSGLAWSVSDLFGLELWLQVFFGAGHHGHDTKKATSV
jgi:asparagine synthase (glutamine-hydrolysing)